MEDCFLLCSISYCLSSSLCNAMKLSRYILSFIKLLRLRATFHEQNDADTNDNGYQQQESVQIEQCEYYDANDELTADELEIILSRLSIEGLRNDGTKYHELMGEIYELLEDKNARLDELKQAFNVFDHDEDGFITAFELWSVLRRLGFHKGIKYENCEKMIRVCDLDGDGRISFWEFKHMMEKAM